MAQRTRLIAGAMSGTSADGVDVAIVRVGGIGLNMTADLILHQHRPYDASLKQAIFAMRDEGRVALAGLARLGREISLAYAACVNDALSAANLKADDLAAVAAHGQTLFHQPPETIQWLDPALVAAQTGCAVVSDFRRADCGAGGQGAPLVPFADFVLFRHATKNRVLLNIGGIANLTYLPAGGSIEDLIAFDTGPGNCISDHLCRMHDPNGLGYDLDGQVAERGTPHFRTAFSAAQSTYVYRKPPKSTDGPAMIAEYTTVVSAGLAFADELATACLATALSIQLSMDLFLKGWREWDQGELMVSGGGTQNRCLLRFLNERLIEETKLKLAVPGPQAAQAKEAIAFALLGAATLDNFPSNVPSCTGASRAVVLGSITPKPYNSSQ